MNIHLTEDVDFPIWIQTLSHLLGTPAALALTQCSNPNPAARPEQFDPLLTRSDLKTWRERSDIYLAHLEASIRDKTHRLPRFRSLNSRIENYLTADEPRNCLGKFDFPEDLYSTPFAHFYHLAAKVYDVSPSGSLACKIEPDMKRIVASYFPLTFLKAARIACEPEFPDDFPPADFPEFYENQFAAIFADGLADTHVHLGQALLYDDLVMPAMAGIRIPDCAHLHGSGSTKHVLGWYDKRIFLQNILLACRGSLAALTEFIKSENDNFMNFLSGKKNEREYKDADNSERDNRKEDNHLSRDVWEALLRLKCAPDSRRVWESGKDLRFFKREVRRLAMHGGDFRN